MQIENPTMTKVLPAVRLEPDLYEAAKRVADDQEVSLSELVRAALRRIIAEFDCATH